MARASVELVPASGRAGEKRGKLRVKVGGSGLAPPPLPPACPLPSCLPRQTVGLLVPGHPPAIAKAAICAQLAKTPLLPPPPTLPTPGEIPFEHHAPAALPCPRRPQVYVWRGPAAGHSEFWKSYDEWQNFKNYRNYYGDADSSGAQTLGALIEASASALCCAALSAGPAAAVAGRAASQLSLRSSLVQPCCLYAWSLLLLRQEVGLGLRMNCVCWRGRQRLGGGGLLTRPFALAPLFPPPLGLCVRAGDAVGPPAAGGDAGAHEGVAEEGL